MMAKCHKYRLEITLAKSREEGSGYKEVDYIRTDYMPKKKAQERFNSLLKTLECDNKYASDGEIVVNKEYFLYAQIEKGC